MERLKYTDAHKKKFQKWEWQGNAPTTFGMRAVKMVKPLCRECMGNPNHPANWYEACEHFGDDSKKMYWSLRPKVLKTPVYDTDEDGDMILKDEKIVTKMILVPNWAEIAADTSHSDGKAPGILYERHGFRYPEELGLAPMCQFYGCGKAWPTVRTNLGDYCNELHAKLAVANEEEINLVAQNPRLRAQQLREIVI